MFRILLTFLEGIMVGVCNVIPGVSGGTLVVIFNIYDQFMDITSMKFKKIIKNWKFTVPLLLGMLSGILIFSKAITILYTKFPTQTYYFFTGLIIGSIPLLYRYTFNKHETKEKGFGKLISLIGCIAVGVVIIIAFTILQSKMGDTDLLNSELPPFTFGLAVKIFIAGVLGAVAMIIPGISGALLMLIMGVYPVIIAAIPALIAGIGGIFTGNPMAFFHPLILLLPNGIGVLCGLVAGSNLLKFLLRKFPSHTYAVILGLIVGSIINIFPGFKCITSVGCGIGSVICLIAGVAMAYFSSKLSGDDDKQNTNKSETSSDDGFHKTNLSDETVATELNNADAESSQSTDN